MEKNIGWEQLVDKAVDKAGNVFEAVYNSISGAVTTYGPQVVDAVLWVIRIDGIQALFWGFLTLIISTIFWVKLIKFWKSGEAGDGTFFITAIGTFFSAVVVGPILYSSVFNIWVWTQVIKPELWIAKQVVVKIEKMATESAKK